MTVASPQSNRCSPRTHRSPGRVTACSGSAGASSSSVRPSLLPASSRSSSPSPKPISPRSKPSSDRSASSSRSSSSSQPAFSASWLSASTYARFCASLMCASSITGTRSRPELPGGQHPAVPGDDPALPVDQHGIGPAELPDARRDLRHLGIASGCADCGHTGSAHPAARQAIARSSILRTSQSGGELTCFYGQEFRDSAAQRLDTPLLNFAGINRRRPGRSPEADLVDK